MEQESTYGTLQAWYLARLRAEAAELSERSRMTPMARIDTDRAALIQHSGKTQGPVEPPAQRRFPAGKAFGGWLLFNAGLFGLLATKGVQGETLIVLAFSLLSSAAVAFMAFAKLNTAESMVVELNSKARQSALREEMIADYAKDLLFAFDDSMGIVCSNMASVRLLGYLPDHFAGMNLADIAANPDVSALRAKIASTKDGKSFEFELTAVSKYGPLIDLRVNAEWSNRVKLFFATAHDISAEKAVQRARGEFVSMISHDVRAPLQGVLFAIDTLANPLGAEVNEKAAKSLTRMERNVQTVIDLIGELIDFERSSETALTLNRTHVNIHELTDTILDQVRDVATYKSITLANETEAASANVDRARVSRVILNLVANALKFSPNNSQITITSKEKLSSVEIRVCDQGPGIPKQLHGAIFERYFQIQQNAGTGGDSGGQSIPGSGLGLAICKAFVEAHGGLIGVESNEGQGSTFWFTLPK